jgi:CRISPR-associated protein Csm4
VKSFKGDLWYELGSKRGRSADGSQRKQFKFFGEGSSFPRLEQEIYGQVIEVASKALEYGLAYTVGDGLK